MADKLEDHQVTERLKHNHRGYPVLDFFHYEHLPEYLQEVSRPFAQQALAMIDITDKSDPEIAAGLRKLLEAKDCAVRAKVRDVQRG